MESPTDWQLADAELDRLDELLAALPGRDHTLTRDELQGFCAAVAMGPDAELSNPWLDVALGPTGARSASAELVLLMERFRAKTAAAVDTGTLAIDARTTRTGRVDYTGWCRGFLDGVEVSRTDWFAVADPEELAELLFPIDVIAGALPDRERAAYKASEQAAPPNYVRGTGRATSSVCRSLRHHLSSFSRRQRHDARLDGRKLAPSGRLLLRLGRQQVVEAGREPVDYRRHDTGEQDGYDCRFEHGHR